MADKVKKVAKKKTTKKTSAKKKTGAKKSDKASEGRGERFGFRMTAAEKSRVFEAAKRRGTSVSAVLLEAVAAIK